LKPHPVNLNIHPQIVLKTRSKKPKTPKTPSINPYHCTTHCKAWIDGGKNDEIECLECCVEQFALDEIKSFKKGPANMAREAVCKAKCMESDGTKGPR
jgi:hypothetical protein